MLGASGFMIVRHFAGSLLFFVYFGLKGFQDVKHKNSQDMVRLNPILGKVPEPTHFRRVRLFLPKLELHFCMAPKLG